MESDMSRFVIGIVQCFFVLLGIACCSAHADDWPQWMGQKRDGVWREQGLVTRFPKEGLKVRWRSPIGGGYGGPAVANGRVYAADYVANPDVKRPKSPFQRITQPGVE